ncbi:methylated-DNA--[protein]-cysteine S-methyltransferase [Chloroflexota bacterium]
MNEGLKYTIFKTDMGWIGLLASPMGLMKSTLPAKSKQEAWLLLGDSVHQAILSPDFFTNMTERLRLYFRGGAVAFNDKLDLSGATPFRQAVWEKTRLIPYGETRSYLWVAEQTGKPEAARAAGQALGKNPLSVIVPCHRVVASDGSLGGFTGGLEVKRRLLALEGISG